MTPTQAIIKTQEELKKNESLWISRFEEYIEKAVNNTNSIKDKRKKFHKWGQLSVYYTIGRAKDDSNHFDLRFQGQSVGEICVNKDGNVFLQISDIQYRNSCNEKYFTGYPKEICVPGSYDWKKSSVAKTFRSYFKHAPEKKGHPEHRFENLLLKEFKDNSSRTKSLVGIQPVTIGKNTDLFFQMPTPLTASGEDIVYSNGHGGIDILARRRHNNITKLTVIELKDEYKESENPEKVITQAVAYATFIAELCKTKANDNFWKLCGFSGSHPKTINVSILMPDPDGKTIPSFVGQELNIPGSDIKLALNFMFFDKDTFKITRTSF